MANQTDEHAERPAQQRHTPGVGQSPGSIQAGGRVGAMGGAPTGVGAGGQQRPSMTGVMQTPDTPGADPVLFEDIEPVLLARLYPAAMGGMEAARGLAMEAGHAAQEAGLALVADQQLPVSYAGEPTDQPSSHRPQTAPTRPGEASLHGGDTAAGQAYRAQQHAEERSKDEHKDDKGKH
jgi:hypothetical protein